MSNDIGKIALSAILALLLGSHASGQSLRTQTGALSDGAQYIIDVPGNWNGTLLVYSHGYVPPGYPNVLADAGDAASRMYLLSQGYALAGSSFATTGWAVRDAFVDQIGVLDLFDASFGIPKRTITWGHSLGGLISAGLVQQFPQRFSGALPMCGVLAGSVGFWNQGLDSAFAFKTLLAPASGLQLVNITNPLANLELAEQILSAAQATPRGRARIALAAALFDTPGWFSPLSPEPQATDYASREANQFLWLQQIDFPGAFAFRSELEARAGGNPSWNNGINYAKQLDLSKDADEVRVLYAESGLSLTSDLELLAAAPRIDADPTAVEYLRGNIALDGEIEVPVLTLHTTDDGLVPVEDEQAYKAVVARTGNNDLLRELFVHRAGHCSFTPAEQLVALQTLIQRLDNGKWDAVDSQQLNQKAIDFGLFLNVVRPGFVDFEPHRFLRPFDDITLPH